MQLPRPIAALLTRRAAAETANGSRVGELEEQVVAERNERERLAESVIELERALFEPGWVRLTNNAEIEFSPEGMVQMRAACRLYAIKSPLIKRGLGLRSAYVWGQGCETTARANGTGHDGEQDVQAVVNQFMSDPGNVRAFTGAEACDQLERYGLGCEGNVFLALFTRPTTGRVQVRVLPPDEIVDVVTNPQDSTEPWYYRRRWVESVLDPKSGFPATTQREQFYPAIDYKPTRRPDRFGDARVAWDSPVLHVAVNRPRGWRFGVPDSYAAVDWAAAYKDFLTDWARLMRALSRYAWKVKTPAAAATAVRAKVATPASRSDVTGEPLSAGATAIVGPEQALEAVGKSGASFDAESGRPLAMMVAAALGVPVTMLLADPGQTGARATAETLDRPTELEMGQRRELWTAARQRVLAHVITESVRAKGGLLKGSIAVDDETGQEMLALAGDTDPTIDVVWPRLDEVDTTAMVEAVVKASTVGVVPPEEILRLLLTALGVRNVDTMVEELLDDDGNFAWPDSPPVGLGSQAVDLFNSGGDAAQAGPGSMQPGEPAPTEPVTPTDKPV